MWTTLLDALCDHLDLTGTKKGCDRRRCGACRVPVDGRRINSFLALAVVNDDAEVTTIDDLTVLCPIAARSTMGTVRRDKSASAAGLIAEGKTPNVDEIRELMSGNIRRCGGYSNILAAIQPPMRRS
jgi:xanthine dehydrogenase YagT iron-sulfur-binding subunit